MRTAGVVVVLVWTSRVVMMLSMHATGSVVSIVGGGVTTTAALVRRCLDEGWTPVCASTAHQDSDAVCFAMPDASTSIERHVDVVLKVCASLPPTCRSVCLVSSLTLYDVLLLGDDTIYSNDELRAVCSMELCEYAVISLPSRIHTRIFRPNALKVSGGGGGGGGDKVMSSAEQVGLAANVVGWLEGVPDAKW